MAARFIDVHAHVNFAAYDQDRDEVVARALENDTWMVNVGTQYDTSKKAVEMAERYEEGVYAIIGLHPIHTSRSRHDSEELGEGAEDFTSRGEEFDMERYRALAASPKVVGIGECGLDYYRLEAESIERQREAFSRQIALANEMNKPLMLHIRPSKEAGAPDAYDDAIAMLKEQAKVAGNAHFFAGTALQAKKFSDLGFTVSFTGVITFTRDYDEAISSVPLDRLLSETDCPYVTPTPHRGKRNEPVFVAEVVRRLAAIKGIGEEEMAQAVMANARRLFGWE
ncbi:MAG TPA: TatD family hydrolase [Candidatus Paceibacterota bacterium]|nr:TatD family hydrolase [Candidatus Paceibacterota bacterium]